MAENDIRSENDKKKEYLNSYKKNCDKLISLEEQLKSLREVEQSAKIQKLSDMPKGSRQTDLSDYIVRIERVLLQINEIKSVCMKQLIDIEDSISRLENGIECQILHKKYVEFKEWEKICCEIGYCWRQTHRYHSRALTNFKMAYYGTR